MKYKTVQRIQVNKCGKSLKNRTSELLSHCIVTVEEETKSSLVPEYALLGHTMCSIVWMALPQYTVL